MKVREAESDRSKYNFKPSEIGDSWLIGTDVHSNPNDNTNAFKNGVSDCPYNLIIPSTLTDDDGQTKKVEIIGQFAFYGCASNRYSAQTRKLTLTKQVKVIKLHGLGLMEDLEEFTLEDGSVLETIESHGLDKIGVNTGYINESNRITLTLPSTLSSVFENGFWECNLFNVIVYCGSNPLTNPSLLEIAASDTVVKVSSKYPSGQSIFGRSPDRNSETEVAEKCSKMEERRDFISVPTTDGDCEVIGWGNSTGFWCPLNLIIPSELNGSTVVSIKENAFANCDTEGPILLPSSLTRVGASAFANTSFVTSVSSNSMKLEIGETAFQNCGKGVQQPINVTLPQNITLSKNAFAGAKIGEVYVM